MKKVILLVTFILLFCGCSATYNLDIDKLDYSEDVDIYLEKTSINRESVDILKRTSYPAFFSNDFGPEEELVYEKGIFYERNVIDDGTNYGINFNYKYTNYNFNDSNIIKSCYQYFTFLPNDDGYRTFLTSKHLLCMDSFPELENVTIRIKTKYIPTYHNADEVEGDTYIWKVDRNNYKNHPISLRLSKEHSISNSKIGAVPKTLFFSIIIFLIVVGIFALYFYLRNKKVNKI